MHIYLFKKLPVYENFNFSITYPCQHLGLSDFLFFIMAIGVLQYLWFFLQVFMFLNWYLWNPLEYVHEVT